MEIRILDSSLEKFIESLEKPTIAKVLRILDLLEKFGYNLEPPHSKKISHQTPQKEIRTTIQKLKNLDPVRN